MKKKGFKRILTICMCAAMLIESVNVSTFTVKAGTADAITQDSELKDAVENGENADQAAYEAAQKAAEAAAEAEAAAKAAKELGEAAADAALDPDAAQAPALKEEIDKEISDAETAVADSNNKIEEESGKLETIAEEAKDKTAEEAQKAADAADAAQDAAKKAEDLKKQIEAADRADAKLEDVLDAAKQAADEAQAAADQAKEAYGNAQAVLDAAQKKYDDAKAQAEQDIQAGIENADKELEEAEAALAAAEAAVSQAEDAYTAATGSNEIAQKTAEAAAEAAKQAGIADDAAKDAAEAADVADARKTAKEEDNAILEAEKSEIVKAQEDLKSEIAQKENEIKDLNQQIVAKNAEIDATEKAIEDLGWKRFVVETDEYKQAKKLNAQIDALEADIDDLKDDIADANDAIDAKQSEIAKKDTEIAGKDAQIAENNTYIAGIVASQKTVQDFVDNNPDTQITYLDKEKQEEFSTLLKELEASTAKYEDAKELREEYQDATDRSGVGLIEWFKKVYKELKIEAANDNAKIEMDWENLQLVYTNDGLTLLLGKNKDNEQVLLTWENNRLTATKVDEHEFAAYSTAFDAAAAAQASTKAAQAATDAAAARQAEKEALDQYNAAKAALEAARERLAAARKAKLNELQLKAAQEALEQAKQNVEAAKKSYEDAQDAADEAKKAYEDAKDNFDNKPVTARFYILNRGLAQPSEVGHYPAGNYSKVQFGELYKGEDNSYLDQYAKGLKNQDLAAYIKQAPTAEAFGITLKEGESIQWYVIKTENDGIHVDGIILGQKFNVTVHYGYEDEQGNFVKVAEDYTGIYGLELEASTAKYEDAKELREEYQDATDRSGVGLIEWFKKVYKELKIEAANDNAKIEMDWENLQLVYTNDGLTLLLGKNKDNEQVLLTWENNRLTATKVDEHEFAAYSTAFDAAAAAQASTKAAQAATDAAAARQAEKEALDQYNAAKAALEAARERLAAARKAKLNELQLKAAQEALEQAKQNVEAAKKSYEDAQDAADEAKKAYEDAKDNFDNKPVTARFYILNRGLAQPSEVGHYPAGNYSKVQFGELYKGEDNSYLDQYAKGLKNQDLAAYIKQAPTAEAFGITLKEGESIQWYVIKTENDGIHVDGIILGQKFNVTVHYGYEDEQGNFVKVAEDYTGIYGLGETYDIPSPEVVIDGFKYAAKNATQASVSGTAYSDKEYTVLYHKEEGISVTVNYYRASVTGTLLHSEIRNIGVSQAADYGKSLTASDLNAWRPGDCEDGVLVSYEKTENGYVANIVYTAIPVIPSESGTSGGDGDGEGEGGETGSGTVAEAAGGAGGITAGVVQQVAGARQTTAQETTQIADETTPLAPTVTAAPGKEAGIEAVSSDNNVVSIEDEEAPLAATVNCWIHWLILLLTAIYTIYELVRAIHRNRKINELSGEAGQVEM